MPFVSSGGSQVVVGNAITQSRVREKTNVALNGVWAEFANSYVDGNVTNAGQEVGPGSPVTIRASLLTGLSGSGQILTASTITPLTFNNAGVAAAGYAYNLDGSACTLSQISARGSVSSDGQTITLPSGCYVRCDTTSINLNAGDAYVIQIAGGEDRAADRHGGLRERDHGHFLDPGHQQVRGRRHLRGWHRFRPRWIRWSMDCDCRPLRSDRLHRHHLRLGQRHHARHDQRQPRGACRRSPGLGRRDQVGGQRHLHRLGERRNPDPDHAAGGRPSPSV